MSLLALTKIYIMKKLLLLFVLITKLSISQNGSLHFQYHEGQPLRGYKYNNDTLIVPLRMANTSTNNAIGIVNINSERWSITSYSTAFTFSNVNVTSIIMKNLNEGLAVTSGSLVSFYTNNFWQTTTAQTNTIFALSATKFGYYGYRSVPGCGACTYTYVFSNNGTTWNNTLIEANAFIPPVLYKSKNKVYTLHNNLLKASTNGGSSYSSVNSTYTFNAAFPVKPAILTLNDDTILVQANQLHRSFDGGTTWSVIALPTTSNAVGEIAAKNAREIMIIDKFMPYNIYYSNNSGTSWTTYTNLPFYNPGDGLFANEQNFFLNPNYRSAIGSSWQDVLKASSLKPWDLSHTGDIVLAGFSQGGFGYSTNRGHSFSFPSNKITPNEDIMSVKAVDINKFIASDRKGQIYVSTNQGQTWTQKITSTFNNIPRKICVSNDKSLIVVTAVGSAYMSGDAANTFTFLNTTVGNGHFQSIKPVSNKIVDVAPLFSQPSFTLSGFEFYDINSSNARTLTGSISVNVAQDIVDIHMVNDNIGYLLTRNPTNNETIIYKTTDGWVTANTISTIPTPSAGVRTYDPKYGVLQNFGTDTLIISGSGNPVNNQTNFYHISYNQGATWSLVSTNFSRPINTLGNRVYKMIFFNPAQYMALVSDNLCSSGLASKGVFINANASGNSTTASITELDFKNQKNNLNLFPNPSQNQQIISFINTESEVQISIINLSGQLVKSITTKENYFSIEGLNSGMYIVRVTGKDEAIRTAKLVIQ